MDHFIPIKHNGASIPTNMVPACHCCNSDKRSKLPEIWLVKKFGEEQAKIILGKIKEFFSTVRKIDLVLKE